MDYLSDKELDYNCHHLRTSFYVRAHSPSLKQQDQAMRSLSRNRNPPPQTQLFGRLLTPLLVMNP